MVAALSLLQLLEVGVEIGLVGEGRGVDALEHRAGGIAAPIGAGHLHELEGLAYFAGRRHVRTATEILPFALLVDAQVLAGLDHVDEFDLERLALRGEPGLGLLARPELLCEGPILRDDLAHRLVDGREILGRERLGAGEIVVEAVVDDRADRHLRAGPKRLHGFRHHMRGIMPDQFERAGVFARQELDPRIAIERVGKVRQHAVAHHRDGALQEARADGFGDVGAGEAGLELTAVAVREGDVDHDVFLSSVADTLGVSGALIAWASAGRQRLASLRAARQSNLEPVLGPWVASLRSQ